jgi:type I restriction enzyme S subunit
MSLKPGFHRISPEELPSGWSAKQLNELVTVVQGGRLGLTKEKDYVAIGIPAYSAAGQDGYVDLTEFHNQEGIVLSAIGANCGRCFYAEGDWTTLANVQAILPNAELNARFLFYRTNIENYWTRSGSAQPFIKPSSIKTSWIAYPRVRQQRRIAEILSTVDEAIEETEALIAKYQQIKAGLMHDLFTRGILPNGQLRPPRTQAPDLYQESPLGWIPKEWEAKPLAAFTQHDITYGIVQAGPNIENGVPYIRTGDMADDSLVRSELLCTSRAIADSYKRSEVRTGEIVCAIRATVGKVLPVPPELDGANLTQGTARIAPNAKTDALFLLWAMRSDRTQRAIAAAIKGTTFLEITLGDLRRLPVAAPTSREEQKTIGNRLEWCDDTIRVGNASLVKLRQQKQGLMADLLSGRVRVAVGVDGKDDKKSASGLVSAGQSATLGVTP